jgi:hypothetical protein
MDVTTIERKRLIVLTTIITTILFLSGVGIGKLDMNSGCIPKGIHAFIPTYGELLQPSEDGDNDTCEKDKHYLVPHSNLRFTICKYEGIDGLNIKLIMNDTITVLNVWSPQRDIITLAADLLYYSVSINVH